MAELEESSIKDDPSFDCLPVEVIEHVLSYISVQDRIKLQSVCKLWQQVVWSSVSDLSIQIKTSDIFATAELISILQRCGKTLKLVRLAHQLPAGLSHRISTSGVEALTAYCHNLERIQLSDLRLPDSCFDTLANVHAKLKMVSLHNCCGFSEDSLADFLERCEAIEALDISLPPGFTGTCLSSVSAKLKYLNVEHGIPGGRRVALQNITAKCESLVEMRLSCAVEVSGLKTCFDKYAQTLKVLHMGVYVHVAKLTNALNVLHNLEMLSCINLSGQLFKDLAENCLTLKELRVRGMLGVQLHTGVPIVPIHELPSLKVLDISHCIIPESGALVVMMLSLKGQLEEVYANCTSVNKSVFLRIARHCPNLRIFQVVKNKCINNDFVSAFCRVRQMDPKCHPIKFFVKDTSVTTDVQGCDGIELDFITEGHSVELPASFCIPATSLHLTV